MGNNCIFDAHQSIIFGNDFTIDDIIWMGDQPTIASLAEKVGVTETRPFAQLAAFIQQAQAQGRKVHFTPQYRGDNQILKANPDAIDAAHPGMYNKELHRLSCEVIAQGLKDLGLMKGDVKEAVELGAHALFMVHGLGHQIGLDVHDMEGLGQIYVGYDDTVRPSNIFGWASLRMARELKPGFVVSIEPGIYFIPHLIDIWKRENKFADFINYDVVEKYRDFGGIRIEDDLLITETGHRVLGPHLPKGVDELAAIIGK